MAVAKVEMATIDVGWFVREIWASISVVKVYKPNGPLSYHGLFEYC